MIHSRRSQRHDSSTMNSTRPRLYGKILGGLLGFALLRHPLGLLLGAVLGHALDAGWLQRPRPSGRDDAYAELGVDATATDAQIDLAYRRLMARYHPDRLVDASPEDREQAEVRARAINAAYDRIMKMRRRER